MKEIQADFAKDGQMWTIAQEKKMIHLWKKYLRTNEQLKKTVEECNSVKAGRKKDYDELESYIQNNKRLSQNKDEHVQKLMKENENLTKEIKQINIERDAYLREHQAITDLLVTEGLTEFDHSNPQSYIQRLVKERNQGVEKIQQLQEFIHTVSQQEDAIKQQQIEENTQQISEMDNLKTQLHQSQGDKETLQSQLEDVRTSLAAKEEALTSTQAHYEEGQLKLDELKRQLDKEKMAKEEVEEAATVAKKALLSSNQSEAVQKDEMKKLLEVAENHELELHATRESTESFKKEVQLH